MPAERNAFRLGLTLIAFFVLFCAVLWFLAPLGGGNLELQVRYPHHEFGTPLKIGAEVVCGGITVGSVRKVEPKEMKNEATGYDDYYTVITIKVDSAMGLRSGCRIEPSEALLGGMGILVIKDRGLGEPLKAGQMVDGEPVSSITDLTGMLGKQLDPKNPAGLMAMMQSQLDTNNARSLVSKLHRSLDDINVLTHNVAGETNAKDKAALLAKLHQVLDHVNEATAALRQEMSGQASTTALAKIHRMLDQLNLGLSAVRGILDDNREPLRSTVRHVEETSRIFEQQIAARLAEQLDTSNAAGLLTRIHMSIDKLGHSLDDLNSVTGDVRDVVTLNKNNLDTLISNLKETSDHLKAGSKEIRLNPWLLLYTPTQNQVAQSNLFGTARAFSEAATRLDDAVGRLQAISNTNSADAPDMREEIEKVRGQLKDAFSKFTEVEQKLWEQLNIR